MRGLHWCIACACCGKICCRMPDSQQQLLQLQPGMLLVKMLTDTQLARISVQYQSRQCDSSDYDRLQMRYGCACSTLGVLLPVAWLPRLLCDMQQTVSAGSYVLSLQASHSSCAGTQIVNTHSCLCGFGNRSMHVGASMAAMARPALPVWLPCRHRTLPSDAMPRTAWPAFLSVQANGWQGGCGSALSC